MIKDNSFEGFVLAGGKSSRMGVDKAFLKFENKTFLERAVETLSASSENRVKVVLNQNQTDFIAKLPASIQLIFDIFQNRGALGGIHAALANCQSEFALILACDMPFVTREAIEQLKQIALDNHEFAVFVPRQTDGKLQPLCAVYRVEECLPQLEKYLAEESSNAMKDFLNHVAIKIIEADKLSECENLLFNVNEPADFGKMNG